MKKKRITAKLRGKQNDDDDVDDDDDDDDEDIYIYIYIYFFFFTWIKLAISHFGRRIHYCTARQCCLMRQNLSSAL